MKLQLGSDSPITTNTVVDGVMYVLDGPAGPIAQKRNSNFGNVNRATYTSGKIKARWFPMTNALVVQLDAEYKIIPNQDDWIDYANVIANDWQACTNCEIEGTAQKLYRVVNLNRIAQGETPGNGVPSDPIAITSRLDTLFIQPQLDGTLSFQFGFGGDDSFPCRVTALITDGVGNPWIEFETNPVSTEFPQTSPEGIFAMQWINSGLGTRDSPAQNAHAPSCTSGTQGQPGPGIFETVWQDFRDG